MKNWIIFFFLFSCVSSTYSQEKTDSLPYTLYKNRVVLFSDLGFNSAPFSIKDNFNGGETNLKYKHNLRLGMGLGIMYKWFALRVGFGLPRHLRPVSRFGKSQFLDVGFRFNFKKTFWGVNYRLYEGYSILNANEWNDTLNNLNPHLLLPNVRSFNFSTNAWFFRNDNLKMPAVLGKVGHYKKDEGTWYYKGTFNIFGVGDKFGAQPLTPEQLIDTTQSKSYAYQLTAMDIGIVPGYAHVWRLNNWQLSAFGGLGGVVQIKTYRFGNIERGVLGLAPRIDLRFIAGYSKSDYFFWFVTNFDVKSIRFREMRYNQTYYKLKVVAGIRLKEKEKKKKSKS